MNPECTSHQVEDIKGSSDRAFGFVFTAFFILVAIVYWWRTGRIAFSALTIAAGFALIALLRPALLAGLNRLWFRFGMVLHAIVNPLVMAVIFFGVVTPVALLMFVAGKRVQMRKPDRAAVTYWILRDVPGSAPESMKNQF